MPSTPSTRISLLAKYSIPYHDGVTQTSNRFYLTTADGAHSPADLAQWHDLIDAFAAEFVKIIGPFATLDEIVGYDIGDEVGHVTQAVNEAGTLGGSTPPGALPSECCALLKWTTDGRTSKNHPIYLYNYVHGQGYAPAHPEIVAYNGAGVAFGVKLSDAGSGLDDGTTTWIRSSKSGQAALVSVFDEYVHFHDLFA